MSALYEEALDMAAVAVGAIDNYDNDPVVRAQVQTYLGISDDNIALLPGVRSQWPAFTHINDLIHSFSALPRVWNAS